mgnify:CR=1 FL=1
MKLLLIFFTLLLFSCSSDKDKKVDLEIFKKQGEKINVFEVNNVLSIMGGLLISLVRDLLTVIGLMGYLLYLNWRLTLVVFIIFPIIPLMRDICSFNIFFSMFWLLHFCTL